MSDKMDREITELLLKNAFEEYENARCDEIIEKYKDTEPDYSEEHKRRMEKLFKKEKKSFCWGKFVKRAAMIILAVFLSGALALQVEAVRIRLEKWYYEITGEAIHIGDSMEDLPGYPETDMPIYVLSDEFVEKYEFSVMQEISEKVCVSEYKNANGKYIKIIQHLGMRNLHFDNDSSNIEKKVINGKEALIIKNSDNFLLYWREQEGTISIFTNFDEKSIQEIVNNFVMK